MEDMIYRGLNISVAEGLGFDIVKEISEPWKGVKILTSLVLASVSTVEEAKSFIDKFLDEK